MNPMMMQQQLMMQQQMMMQQQQQQQMMMMNPQYLLMQPQPTTGWFVAYIQQTNPQELHQFMSWFGAIDKDHSGTIEAREVACIQFGGRNITINTATCMLKAFDTDNSGSITFWEYVALHKFIMQLQMGFMAADHDRSGRISLNEISTALQNAGFSLTPQLMTVLMHKFDSSRSGQLDFEGYLAMAAHLAHMKTLFEINSRGTGSVTFDFMKFTEVSLFIIP